MLGVGKALTWTISVLLKASRFCSHTSRAATCTSALGFLSLATHTRFLHADRRQETSGTHTNRGVERDRQMETVH